MNPAQRRATAVIAHADENTPYAYEIEGLLGKGAFGLVYRARLMGPEGFVRPVALKVLKPAYAAADELVEQLRDEALALASLHHPAFIRVDRLVRLDLGWAVVMEQVRGLDLSRLLARVDAVPLGAALEIVSIVAGALHVAWTAPGADGRPLRLMHRDLKPSNLMITPYGEVKICDLGTCRAQRRRANAGPLPAFGTPDYAAPERFDGVDGPEGDLYALGVVLYELLSGERFGLASPVRAWHDERWQEVVASAAALLRPRGLSVEPVLDLIRYSLAFSPAERPTAEAFEAICLAVRAALPDEGLRAWAGRVLPPLMYRPPALDEDDDGPTEEVNDEETPTLAALPALLNRAG